MRLFNSKLIILLLLMVFSYHLHAATKEKSIRILNWWDFLDSKILKKLDANKLPIEIVEYRSNEVAISKLSSKTHNFDIAILSSINLKIAKEINIINSSISKQIISQRKGQYDTSLLKDESCVPFMWSPTIFSYDKRFVSSPPVNFNDLLKLKEKHRVGIVDDQYEVAARALIDMTPDCKMRDPFKNCINNIGSVPTFDSKLFVSSIESLVKDGNFVVYGWHGEAAAHVKNSKWLSFSLPQDLPVIGMDHVCALNGSKRSQRDLEEAIRLLTDQQSIQWNAKNNQYFSVYVNDTVGLQPSVAKLYRDAITQIRSGNYVNLSIPDSKSLSEINKWWKNVRYNK